MEQIVLDPIEEATGREEVDITDWIAWAGPDYGDAQIDQYMAEAARGQLPVDFRIPNRTITVPFMLKQRGTDSFAFMRQALQAKAALFQREGGWLKRETAIGPLYADIVGATLKLGGGSLQATSDLDVDAVLTLEAPPDFYGVWTDLPGTLAAGAMVWTVDGVEGNYPGRVRIIVGDGAGQNRRGLIWGIRSRHFDTPATARLIYDPADLTLLDAAIPFGVAVTHPSLSTGWTPVFSTEIAGIGHMNHTGTYEVWVSATTSSTVPPQARLLYDVGDLTLPVENAPVQIPGTGSRYGIKLGQIRLDPASIGSHRWLGQVEAKGAASGDNVTFSDLWIVPVDEGYGELRAVDQPAYALGPRSAGTFADDATVGTVAWAFQAAVLFPGDVSHYLKATNFGFALPASATIKGIQVDVQRHIDHAGFTDISDNTVRIVKGGTIQATDRASATPWPALAPTYISYGGPTDLWGTTWSVANVNASNFGFVISAKNTSGINGYSLFADDIRITVYYTFGPADAVCYANQTAELRTEGMIREDFTGVSAGPMSQVIGDLPRIPPSGMEGRITEIFVAMSRGDFATLPDTYTDSSGGDVQYRPSFLFVPSS